MTLNRLECDNATTLSVLELLNVVCFILSNYYYILHGVGSCGHSSFRHMVILHIISYLDMFNVTCSFCHILFLLQYITVMYNHFVTTYSSQYICHIHFVTVFLVNVQYVMLNSSQYSVHSILGPH